MRRLFEGGTYLSNYCNLQLKSLLHLGQNVITFRTLLHVGSFISFRPSFKSLLEIEDFKSHLAGIINQLLEGQGAVISDIGTDMASR